jgi:hypothetical protein
MDLNVSRLDVWIAKLKDTPGSLSGKMATLRAAGVNLDFVFARRSPEKPGTGVAFLAPIKGAKQAAAAKKAGFKKAKRLVALAVSGPNKAGMGAIITAAIADAGVSLQGFLAHVIGRKFVLHIAFDTAAEATKAGRVIRKL